jgi:hypothetical protein
MPADMDDRGSESNPTDAPPAGEGSGSAVSAAEGASSLAYFDVFLMLAVLTLVLTPVVLLMKISVAEKGSHAGPEWLIALGKEMVRQPNRRATMTPSGDVGLKRPRFPLQSASARFI